MMQTNQNGLIMEGLRNKSKHSGASVNSDTWGSYDMGNSSAWGKWHIAIFDKTKGGGNKVEYGGLYMMWKTVTKVEQ